MLSAAESKVGFAKQVDELEAMRTPSNAGAPNVVPGMVVSVSMLSEVPESVW